MADIVLVTGGCRSGKSAFALQMALKRKGPRVFIATARALDREMKKRIEKHRRDRPAGFRLIEEPLRAGRALSHALRQGGTAVFDCVTLWVSNLMQENKRFDETRAEKEADAFIRAAKNLKGRIIVVTNEVGWGIVPVNQKTRKYRDCVGRINQVLAAQAGQVHLLVSGVPFHLK